MSGPEDRDIDGAFERLQAQMEKGFGGLRAETGMLRTEMGELRTDMEKGFGAVRTDMERGFGAVRTDMERGFGAVRTDMEKGFGALRAEMIDRDAALVKWFLVYALMQTGMLATLLKLFR